MHSWVSGFQLLLTASPRQPPAPRSQGERCALRQLPSGNTCACHKIYTRDRSALEEIKEEREIFWGVCVCVVWYVYIAYGIFVCSMCAVYGVYVCSVRMVYCVVCV